MTDYHRGWRRHVFYTRESTRTTWRLRLGAIVVALLIVVLTRRMWFAWIGQSLACEDDPVASDVILIENFDPDYLVFERAAILQRAGFAARTLVPVPVSSRPGIPNSVSTRIAEVMASEARMGPWEPVVYRQAEPFSLNAAAQIRDRLQALHVKSIILVTSGFRSRRSMMVYGAVLGHAGIEVHCVPVFGGRTPRNWSSSWHGFQEVIEEFVKLQFYRFYAIPRSTTAKLLEAIPDMSVTSHRAAADLIAG